MSSIDYDLTLIRGIAFDVDGVLSPATVALGDDGIPRRMANLRDGYAMVQAARAGLHMAVISGGDSEALRRRFDIIGIPDVHLGAGDKLPLLLGWMERRGLRPEQVAYMGDDVPDVAPMRHVGLPIAPADACADAVMAARHVTRAAGGYGAAREVIEQILRARGLWAEAPANSGQ
ncbi:MAG: 3-deoxy-D-manno-octulosonate 8-phosphate phosphatase [Bacteroides sp.]|nr:3-deoxy-D-manno-octulosonate 8-phosphate phosphatase [Bacteroides sp.]MCM1094769.1 hypothetical protein [Terasakiella sp.]